MPDRDSRSFQTGTFLSGITLFWAALYVYVPTLAVHTRALGANDTLVGLVVGSYGFTQLVLRIPLGVLSDRLGVRKAFVILGFVCVVLSSIGLALSTSPTHMLLGRALAGVAASSWVASTVLFSAFYPADQAVRATSLLSFASSIGQMSATLAGGYIAMRYGAVAPFWVASVIALIGVIAIFPAREQRPRQGSTPSLGAILKVMTVPSLLVVSLVAAVVQYATFTTSYAFVPIFADEVLHLDAAALGVLTSIVMLPYAIISTVVARLSVRVHETWLLTGGLLLLALSTAVTPAVRSYEALLLTRVVFGVGMAFTYPVLMGLSIKTVPQEQRACAMGAFQAIYALGMTAGPALSGLIADGLGLSAVFWVTGLMCLVGLLPIWVSNPAGARAKRSPAR